MKNESLDIDKEELLPLLKSVQTQYLEKLRGKLKVLSNKEPTLKLDLHKAVYGM